MTCPICLENYSDIKQSEAVCNIHQSWLITTCSECGVVSFSDAKGFCMKHGQANFSNLGTQKHDPSWYLKRIGQQGGPVSGF